MKKVITYGTFDMLHYGHIRLLERAKALGDYLIVGVTSEDFDKQRGKINVKQSLMERVSAVKETGLADEIIIEEYEGQKIDDIIKYGIDIFVLGSDWKGKFDYLKEYCEVKYLPRTEGVSSSKIRTKERTLKIGLVGDLPFVKKIYKESKYVNGLEVIGICTNNIENLDEEYQDLKIKTNNYQELLNNVDAIYLHSHPSTHYEEIKMALINKKHVLCESPIVLKQEQYQELLQLAKQNNVVLMEALKTAFITAYLRLLLLIKSGIIGKVICVESTCTSLKEQEFFADKEISKNWNCICEWGPTAMLPIFQILGVNYNSANITTMYVNQEKKFDSFTKIDFYYNNAVGSLKVAYGVKSEGNLIISGTKGYIFVPAPWWKTDYFEIRFENQTDNRRYFYHLDGEGIRYELIEFVKNVKDHKLNTGINFEVSNHFIKVLEKFYNNEVNIINNK